MIKKYFIENIADVQRINHNLTAQFCINTVDYKLLHSHADYWEFCIVTDGTLQNHINSEVRAYPAGTLFYCTTKDVHYLTIDSTRPTRYINFTIAEQTLMKMLSPFSDNTIKKLYANNRSYTLGAETISKIEKTLHILNLLPANEFEKTNDILLAQIMFFVQLVASKTQNNGSKNDPVWMQKLQKLKFSKEFFTYSIDDLCKQLNYSRAQLNRLFNTHFGMSPHEYLLSNRLIYAQNLLITTDLNTTEIANAIGYSNPAQFHATFKSKFGVTPAQYRKNRNSAPASI